MNEPTDETVMALWCLLPSEVQDGRELDDIRPWVAAVLDAAGRERPTPNTARAKLDAAIAESLPLAGHRVRKRLVRLRDVLAEVDAQRAATAAANRGRQ